MRTSFFKAMCAASVILITCSVSQGNLLVNGDFEAGNTGFSTGYQFQSVPHRELPEGKYGITFNPTNLHWAAVSYGDHTSGSGLMLTANGARTANSLVWSQTVNVPQGARLAISMWVSRWDRGGSSVPPQLKVFINGAQVGASIIPSFPSGVWREFSEEWDSGTATDATVEVRLATAHWLGNEFSLDDLRLDVVEARPDVSSPIAPTGVVTDTTMPVFTWAEAPYAEWYYLWISRDGVKYFSMWTQRTTWTPGRELPDGEYKWWVQTWNRYGYGEWSAPASFEMPLRVPAATTLLAPLPTVSTNRPAFAWQEVEYALWYRVYVQRNGKMFLDRWVEGDAEYTPAEEDRLSFGEHRWWVRTWGRDGYGPWSMPGSFSYGTVHPLAPRDEISAPRPEFSWTEADGATWYQVWLSGEGGERLAQWIEGSSRWTPDQDLPPGAYTWYVRAWNPDGMGPWSGPADFEILPPQTSDQSVILTRMTLPPRELPL